MKKLLLILLCLPMIGFGQDNIRDCYITDTVRLVDKMDYMDSYDLTFKSLTTIRKESHYIEYPDEIETKTKLKDFLIVFDHFGWSKSLISWEDMKVEDIYIIKYSLRKYKRELPSDVTWGYEVVFGNHLYEVKKLKKY